MAELIDGKLTDRVWNLPVCRMCVKRLVQSGEYPLEDDRNEAGVETAHTTFTQKSRETGS